MTEGYYLNLWFLPFICTPGKSLRGKYRDTDRQMKPLFFKCHDSKTWCKEGGATTCTHSLQSLKQGLKFRASGVRSVICCKHDMKEAESKTTRFVHLLEKKRAQFSNACIIAVAQDLASHLDSSTSDTAAVHVRRACRSTGTICIFPSPRCLLPSICINTPSSPVSGARIDCNGPSCLFSVWDSWEECAPAPRH